MFSVLKVLAALALLPHALIACVFLVAFVSCLVQS